MGLRDTVAKRRAERAKPKSLAELKARKRLAELKAPKEAEKPKSLAELKAQKDAKKAKPKTLAALKKSKNDISIAGVKFHNVQQMDGFWTVDMTNGDKTYTLHNRHGAWFHDVREDGGLHPRTGPMAEPVRVALALGIHDSQLEVSQALSLRLERELRSRGIPTREQLVRQHEEEAKAARRKGRKTPDS